jgi:hypothetical protein
MAGQYYVTVTVTPPNGDAMPPRELGELRSTWNRGISIGSDAGCNVVLSGLAPVAAIVLAGSNHKLLYRYGSPAFEQAKDYTGGPLGPYDERVDYREFYVGDYLLRFGHVSRDEPKSLKKLRWFGAFLILLLIIVGVFFAAPQIGIRLVIVGLAAGICEATSRLFFGRPKSP